MHRDNEEELKLKVESLERELQEMKARIEALEAKLNQEPSQLPARFPNLRSLKTVSDIIPTLNETPSQRIEVVRNPKDPSEGYLILEVKGPTSLVIMGLSRFSTALEAYDFNDKDGRRQILLSANSVCSSAIVGLDMSHLRDKLPFYKTEKISWRKYRCL